MIGRCLGRYQILSKLGQGGMGSVWKAQDTLLGRIVALKLLPESLTGSPQARHRLLREARAASALNHPGIATVFDAGEAEGNFYIAVEYVNGETVTDLAARGPLEIDEALRVVIAAADALAHAHARGVVHRDISGRNIMVASDGRVAVLDFGLALPDGTTRITAPGAAVGTVAYMAPEIIQGGSADARTDIYGLGVVLYEMLTGTLPFVGERQEAVLYAAVHEPLEPPGARRGGISAELNRIVLRALAKEPKCRHQTAADLGADLARLEGKGKRRSSDARGPSANVGRAAADALSVAETPTEAISTAKCLAILPFQDLGSGEGADPRAQVFANGLAETVSASLAKRSEIHVIPPSSAAPGTFLDEDLRRVGRNLGANVILRGTVQRSGDRIRIAYSLLHPDRCVQIAGDTIDGSFRDLFAVEDRLVESVVRSLQLQASAPRGEARAAPRGEVRDPVAHEHYLQALGYLQRFEDAASIDGAIALLERLLDAEGDTARVHAALGRAYLCKYKLTREARWEERARTSCLRALELDPRSPDVLGTMGHLHISLGRPADAVRDFRQALKLRRDNPDALLGLAEAYEMAGKPHEAEEACRTAIAQRQNFWGGYNRLGILHFSRGQYERAIEPWKRVVELTPDNVRGWNNLGAAYFQLGRYRDALETYHRSLEILPSAAAYSSLGTVHFFLGNHNEAAAMFEKGVALRPSDPRMWGNLADAYRLMSGMEDKAAATLDRAIGMQRELLHVNPKDAEGWADLAGWLAKRGDAREAAQAVQRALKIKPDDVNFMAAAGRVYHLAGARAKAMEWLTQAIERGYSVKELLRDPELKALHSAPAFLKFIKDEEQNLAGK